MIFARHRMETMKSIDGQLSFFDEADTLRDESAGEPEEDQVIPPRPRKKETINKQSTVGLLVLRSIV